MLRLRRETPDIAGEFGWLPSEPEVLSFSRGDRFISITNLSQAPVRLPAACSILLASAAVSGDLLPVDATVWLLQTPAQTPDGAHRPAYGGE
jgi:alpha-glucosidase